MILSSGDGMNIGGATTSIPHPFTCRRISRENNTIAKGAIMNINIKNIDVTKLDLGLRHEYVLDAAFNKELPEEERIVIDCEFLKVGERTAFLSVSPEDNEVSMDIYRKMFLKKVKGIRNLVINGKPVTTAEELLKYPSTSELDAILIFTGNHILNADVLTEDEEKNSESGSNS